MGFLRGGVSRRAARLLAGTTRRLWESSRVGGWE
jgi:hypothetical protein